jgi:hypothetical protein
MRTYRIYASQMVYHYRDVVAESEEQAEEIAFEHDSGMYWEEFQYGDWQIDEVKEITE